MFRGSPASCYFCDYLKHRLCIVGKGLLYVQVFLAKVFCDSVLPSVVSAGWQEPGLGPGFPEWALTSSWDLRILGPGLELGGARPISCPSCSGVAGPWAPWAGILEAFLNQCHPLEAILLSLCKQGGCPMAHGLLCEIHLWKKNYSLSRASWHLVVGEAF